MISASAVACFFLTYWMLPPDTHARAMQFAGKRVLAPDERVVAWWQRRSLRTPGQARTTQLVQMVMSELNAGILTGDAFRHVLGPEYSTPASLLNDPPTVDVHVWADVGRVWAASDEAGFSLAGAMQRIHAYALVDQEITREVQATASAPNFALLSIVAMPVGSWFIGVMIGADPVGFLLHNHFGWLCLAIGISLYVIAWRLMRGMARRAMA